MKIILEEEDISKNELPKEAEEKFFNYGEEKIKHIKDIKEEDKGKWIEHTAEELHEQFKSLMRYTEEGEGEIDNVDWSALNYQPYGADYYAEKFEGFAPEIYEILAESSKAENAIIDNRIPHLKMTDGSFNPFGKDS